MTTKHIVGGDPHPYKKGGDGPHPHMKDGGQPVSERPSATPFSFNDWLNHFRQVTKIKLLALISAQDKSSPDVQITLEDLIVGPDESFGFNQIMLRNMVLNKLVHGRPLGPKFQFMEEDDKIDKDELARKVLDFWLTPGS
jgi:hypothetical protein